MLPRLFKYAEHASEESTESWSRALTLSPSLFRVFHKSPTEATRRILPFLLTTSMRSTWGVATLPSTLALALSIVRMCMWSVVATIPLWCRLIGPKFVLHSLSVLQHVKTVVAKSAEKKGMQTYSDCWLHKKTCATHVAVHMSCHAWVQGWVECCFALAH